MFCSICGRELIGSHQLCPYCGANTMTGTSFCPYCGVPTVPQARICPKCGAQLPGKGEVVAGAWMPLTAGILDIIAGAIGVAWGIIALVLGAVVGGMAGVFGLPGVGWFVAGAAALPLALGIVAIIGGVYALKRRVWGLALAGSICSLIVWFLGIPAIVFTALGKGHFK